MCLGFAPIVAFFVGAHAVFAIGYPQRYTALVPLGVTCFLLAADPSTANLLILAVNGLAVNGALPLYRGLKSVYV